MSRLISYGTALAAIIFLIASCWRNEPAWNDVPSPPDLMYKISIRTYGGGYADKPFDIKISSKMPLRHESTVVQTDQCKNVKILARRDYVYIFYDELALNGFSSFQYHNSLPRPFLCDVRHQFCRSLLQVAEKNREPVYSVCTYSGRN